MKIYKKYLVFISILFLATLSYGIYPFQTIKTGTALTEPVKIIAHILNIKDQDPEKVCQALQNEYGRKPHQERSAIAKNPNLEKKREVLWPLFQKMGMIDTVLPSKQADIIVIHGSTIANMRDRIRFFLTLIENDHIKIYPQTQLYMITGDRDLFDHEYKDILQPKPLSTEGTVAPFILDEMIVDKALRARVRVLVAPKRFDTKTQKWVRPHTGNTIEELFKFLPLAEVKDKNFLFISSNPNVPYQNAVVGREFAERKLSLENMETVGAPTSTQIEMGQLLDSLRNTMQREQELFHKAVSAH